MNARAMTRALLAVGLLTAFLVVSLVSVVGAGAATAWWTTSGAATGSATTGSTVALSARAGTPSGTVLVPGGTAPLVLTVTNPNPVPVVVGSVQRDPGRAVVVTGNVGACVAPPLTVSATTSLTLAPGSTTTVTMPDAVTLDTSVASGCQGATFTVPVTLSGSTS